MPPKPPIPPVPGAGIVGSFMSLSVIFGMRGIFGGFAPISGTSWMAEWGGPSRLFVFRWRLLSAAAAVVAELPLLLAPAILGSGLLV